MMLTCVRVGVETPEDMIEGCSFMWTADQKVEPVSASDWSL